MTHINNSVQTIHPQYHTYNLAINGDYPSKRIQSIESLILSQPKLVVYGIGIREFSNYGVVPINENELKIERTKNIFPTLESFTNSEFFHDNFNSEFNPKVHTLKFFQGLVVGNTNISNSIDETIFPFAEFGFELFLQAYSNEELSKLKINFEQAQAMALIDNMQLKKTQTTLEEIIQKLQRNNIKIVLFTTPYPQAFWDFASEEDMELYISTMDNISKKYDVPIYYLHNKYSTLDIWSDYWHVTLKSEGIVYSDDLAKIIQDEI